MSVESDHSKGLLKDLAYDLLASSNAGPSKFTKIQMDAFQNLVVVLAGIEVHLGESGHLDELAQKLAEGYQRHAKLLLDRKGLPYFVTQALFDHKDVKQTKKYDFSLGSGDMIALWRKYIKMKRDMTNRDNKAVKAAIRKMPGGAVPSGTSIKTAFFPELIAQLYAVKHLNPKEVGVGGSAAKAGTGLQLIEGDVDEGKDGEGQEGDGSGNDDDASDLGENELAGSSPSDATRSKKRPAGNNPECKNSKSKLNFDDGLPPGTYFPANLLALVEVGVLSNEIQAPLDYAVPSSVGKTGGSTGGPSRLEMREHAAKEADLKRQAAKGGQSSSSSSSTTPSALPQQDARAAALSKYADAKEGDVKQQAYTNVLVAYQLEVDNFENQIKAAKEDYKELEEEGADDQELKAKKESIKTLRQNRTSFLARGVPKLPSTQSATASSSPPSLAAAAAAVAAGGGEDAMAASSAATATSLPLAPAAAAGGEGGGGYMEL